MSGWGILQGDCIEVMAGMEDACVDAIVTDPPYGLGFMGRKWDDLPPGIEFAEQALRVLKPGGHLLAFGGTRTYHRLACAVEDAGFEIRDSIMWLYGSGFPKSHDVSKAIDKAAGAEREVVSDSRWGGRDSDKMLGQVNDDGWEPSGSQITAPATSEAERWNGWGTALKPAHEPIVVARKPFKGTVAENVLEYGTGAINVDACRIAAAAGDYDHPGNDLGRRDDETDWRIQKRQVPPSDLGRWPANVVLSHTEECEVVGTRLVKGDPRETGNGKRPGGFADVGADAGDGEPNAPVYGDESVTEWNCAPGCPVATLDAQSGERRSAGEYQKGAKGGANDFQGPASVNVDGLSAAQYADSGGASRFFYCAKASRRERNAGLEGFEGEGGPVARGAVRTRECNVCGSRTKKRGWPWPICGHENWTWVETRDEHKGTAANHHPTVKPIDLMRWLVRLVTPPDGLILDPFAGSGTTGCAAVLEGFDFTGIEREPEYVEIAKARIEHWANEAAEAHDQLLLAA